MARDERDETVLTAMPTSTAHVLPIWAKPRADGRGLVLTLHVQPGARASGPAGRHGEALKLRIAAPATDNKANEALAAFLQRELDIPRAAVRIAHGRSSRHKVVEIAAAPQSLAVRLNAWDRSTES
jgi:uncharacterized protein